MQQKPIPSFFPVDPFVFISLGLLRAHSLIETTSFDQKPFLTPSQFGLYYFQACPEALSSKKAEPTTTEKPRKKHTSKACKKFGGVKRTMCLRSMNKVPIPESQEFDIIQKKVKSDEAVSNISTHYEDNTDTGIQSTNSSETLHIMPLKTEIPVLCGNSTLLKCEMTEQSTFLQIKEELVSHVRRRIASKEDQELGFKYEDSEGSIKEEHMVFAQNIPLKLESELF